MKNFYKSMLYAGSLMILGGCSSFFSMDEQKFACEQASKGMPCMTVRTAFAASESYDPDAQIGPVETGKKRWWGKKRERRNGITPFLNEVIPDMASSNEPKPLLMPAQVMSVWVNNYEDAQGNLVYPTRIYSEIQSRKWDTGYRLSASENKHSRRVTPLVSKQNDFQEPENQNAKEVAQDVAASQPDTGSNSGNSKPIPDSLPAGLIPPLQ